MRLPHGRAARLAIRRNAHSGPTSGLAPGFVQANLAILPQALAQDFLQFCQRNPKPCPLIGVSAPGDPRIPDSGRRSRYPHRPAALSRLARRRAGRRAERYPQILARRSRHLRHRLLVLVRAGVARRRHRTAPHDARLHRADVPHVGRDRAGGTVPRAARRFDAADEARRRHPRRADHHAISLGARRAGASRQAGIDRDHGYRQARLGRRGADPRRRDSGVLGLRGDAAIGDHGGASRNSV